MSATPLTEQDLAAFERRAAEAEARLEALEGRGGAAVSGQVQDQLRALQQQLEAAQRKLEEDKAQADETIRELRAENEKLKYRVLHLVRNAREAEAERPPPPLPPLKRFSTDPFNYASPLSA